MNLALLRSLIFLAALTPLLAQAADKPLRVYILVGQSNMVGQGALSNMDYIGEDPATKELHQSMLNEQGDYRTCDRVWISSLNGKMRTTGGEGFGKLAPGYGNRKNSPSVPGECIGPEYTFGITMEKNYDGPILIIKAAWGGHSLCVDYRSPSAGPYVMPEAKVAKLKSNGSLAKHEAMNKEFTHKYYHAMMNHVQKVLGDIKRVYPDYDESAGYELGGFVWFQAWNDYSAKMDYPDSAGEQQYAPYSELLAHFIRDARKDLDAPEMPFVIGVCGINGNHTPGTYGRQNPKERMERFRNAMAAPADLPEFRGNVLSLIHI